MKGTMSNIQYFHHNNPYNKTSYPEGKYTIALVVPKPEMLLALLATPNKPFITQAGVAFCSPKDQYVKKTGRDLATERMELITVKLSSMFQDLKDPDVYYYKLNVLAGDITEINLRINLKGKKTHFVSAHCAF